MQTQLWGQLYPLPTATTKVLPLSHVCVEILELPLVLQDFVLIPDKASVRDPDPGSLIGHGVEGATKSELVLKTESREERGDPCCSDRK